MEYNLLHPEAFQIKHLKILNSATWKNISLFGVASLISTCVASILQLHAKQQIGLH
jgi:hypothetical protein